MGSVSAAGLYYLQYRMAFDHCNSCADASSIHQCPLMALLAPTRGSSLIQSGRMPKKHVGFR